MSELDRAQHEVDELLKRRLSINPGLESVERHKDYKATKKRLTKALKAQTAALLKDGVLADIDAALGAVQKADRVDSESDELEIYDAIAKKLKPLPKDDYDAFADFLILVFMMGGQDFLNKHNIPYTFDLTNQGIRAGITSHTDLVLKGIDKTTTEWIAKQIKDLRAAGKSNADIANAIKDRVPETYANRSDRIVRTETTRMVGVAEQETAVRNGASHKEWVTVSDGAVCPICEKNEQVGQIGIEQSFPSGDLHEPAHPNCRCLVEYHFAPFMGTIWHGQ